LEQCRRSEDGEASQETAVQYSGTKKIGTMLAAICNRLSGSADCTSTFAPDGDFIRITSERGIVLL